jgi:hypothetical protein
VCASITSAPRRSRSSAYQRRSAGSTDRSGRSLGASIGIDASVTLSSSLAATLRSASLTNA